METNMIITKDEVRKFRQTIPERQSATWEDSETEDCLRMYKDGESITCIAMKHKRSELAIQKKLDDLGACNASKRRRRENRVKCKCKVYELITFCMMTIDSAGFKPAVGILYSIKIKRQK